MTEEAGDGSGDGRRMDDERTASDRMDSGDPADRDLRACDESGCERTAAVRLHVPWDDDREVCPAHARVLARPDGVVAEPIEGAETEWP